MNAMDSEKSYQNSLDYLYSFIDYSLTKALRYSPEKFDLNRMKALLVSLGNPQNAYPVIHIAGTKGKGSVSAYCASAIRSAGYRVGLYTSPHLQDFTERIQINNLPISHVELTDFVEQIKPAVEKLPELTTFELTTAIAFLFFAQKKVDCAVVEVGLGGRLDATNLVDPLLSVITTISFDHMAVLGNTLAAIAGEKAGIIKQGRPVVSSSQSSEAAEVIARIAQEQGCELSLVGRDVFYAPIAHNLKEQTFHIWKAEDQNRVDRYIENPKDATDMPETYQTPLLGFHQLENAATAYAALQVANQNGLTIPTAAIKEGFTSVRWPARFEILRNSPPVILDSAHNRDSAQKLRIALDDYLKEQDVILVFGASEDKDVQGMFIELLPRIKQVIATESIHPRALEAGKIVELAHHFGCKAEAVLPIEAALDRAVRIAGKESAVLVTGSIFVAAAAREAWRAAGNPVID
jgi:dihydrofolate synthase/folylpolyglutamate synthase